MLLSIKAFTISVSHTRIRCSVHGKASILASPEIFQQGFLLYILTGFLLGCLLLQSIIEKMGVGFAVLRKISVVVFLILQFGFYGHAILDPIDFLALQSIRKSLSDLPGSNYFASWDFTSDPCNFAGVYCDEDKVIALNLGDPRAGSPGLTGRLDPAIGKLSALAEFTVVPGRIIGPLPESLSQLKNLRFLAVSRNFISGQIPATLGELQRLQTLDLSFNQLSGSIPWSVGALPALSNVILCHNRLSGQVPPFASQTLTRLDLKHNELSGSFSPTSLPPSLQYLSLSWNQFSGPVDLLLTRLTRLNYLDLSLNHFSGCIPGVVFSFPITNLQLQRNYFSGRVEPVDQVAIPTVDLSYNRLSGEISPLFATVQNLYLNNNRFMGQVPSSLVDRLLSASIQILYLQHNYLTGIDINPTADIPLSSSLCLQYNCMVLPVQTPCPLKAGKQKTRPTDQCIEWKGKTKN
ncbi:OLC1v1007428C1 [Oldenlandia corymbosa var. corymbosa]|uniref:OLC1v1007428C1 n=1 Tax=Oldenlandia corymbosa var. corymbosa TaxID=529605 RepID=A0AAV1DMD9_OLDCO|nr:OLC1v1007428C1 [Oldenlandia corymbosa var. corymbosa]